MPTLAPSRGHDRELLDWELIEVEETTEAPSSLVPDPGSTATGRARRLLVIAAILLGSIVGLILGRASIAQQAIDVTAPAASVGAVTPAPSPPFAAPVRASGSASEASVEGFELRFTSQDGRFEAWAEPLGEGQTIYAPEGRAETTFVVRDTLEGISERVTFDRNLEPEAFSPDGSVLYTIDHRPATDPEVYRVTALDLRSNELRDVIGPWKQPLSEEMRGEGREQVWAPDDSQLYTLYVRQAHVHVGGTDLHVATTEAGEDAFIHVLDVSDEWALCLELPAGFGMGPAGSTALMVTADGDTITVVDHHIGQRVDIERLPTQQGLQASFSIGSPTILDN